MLAELPLLFIDGIGFDNFFRGLLSVLVAVVVLIGGTYLLLATNTGARQGFILSLAGLFGWMFLMGIIWTIYGIGWVGSSPSWELVEINIDDAADSDDGLLFSEVESAQQLAGQVIVVEGVDDPDVAQLLAVAGGNGVKDMTVDSRALLLATLLTENSSDPDAEAVMVARAEYITEPGTAIGDIYLEASKLGADNISDSEFAEAFRSAATAASENVEDSNAVMNLVNMGVEDATDSDFDFILAFYGISKVDLADWDYLPTTDSLRGDAQAAADGFLVENDVFESGEYIPLRFGGFGFGGKENRPVDGNVAEQGWHKVWTSGQVKHPDQYMAIQVRATIEQPTLPGQAPPVATADEEAQLVTVIMKFDRGGPIPSFLSGLRFVPLVFTIANALLFAACAMSLHNRDRRESKIRKAAA